MSVVRDNGKLVIEGHEAVMLANLVSRGDSRRVVFGRTDKSGWRLGFDQPLPPDWLSGLPANVRYGGLIDRIGLPGTIAGGLTVSALILFGLWKLPDLLAPLIPERWEQAFGDAIVGDLGGRACHSLAGQAVLDRLGRQLAQSSRPMRVRVVEIQVPNAVALPGGQIVLFSGLIAQSKSPDEVAGVLGHEIGHVEHRHVMAGLIRQFGFGLVLGSSGRASHYSQALLSARYSRHAESDADNYAIGALTRSHISTAPTAAFFERMGRLETTRNANVDAAFSWLSTHPMSLARRDAFKSADRAVVHPQPSMTAAEWASVRGICQKSKYGKSRSARTP